jgi:ABC-2 type transport system permease protein
MRNVAQVLPSFSYADIGWHIVAGSAPPVSEVVTVAAWAAALCVVAVFTYRRALARA